MALIWNASQCRSLPINPDQLIDIGVNARILINQHWALIEWVLWIPSILLLWPMHIRDRSQLYLHDNISAHSKKFFNHPVEHWATELCSFSSVSCRVSNQYCKIMKMPSLDKEFLLQHCEYEFALSIQWFLLRVLWLIELHFYWPAVMENIFWPLPILWILKGAAPLVPTPLTEISYICMTVHAVINWIALLLPPEYQMKVW